jgi:hypothetical protein
VVSFTLQPLYPQGKSSRYLLDRRLGGPQRMRHVNFHIKSKVMVMWKKCSDIKNVINGTVPEEVPILHILEK